jgi:lipoprotein-anchoring transpeptidase ErfK/SrfK
MRMQGGNEWKKLALAAVVLLAGGRVYAQEEHAARRIVVSIPDRKLVLLEGEKVLKTYDVAVGMPRSPSPVGEFKIVTRVIGPVWKNVPQGPVNPVGTRWLGLSVKGYGIHGTNAPRSIGKAASHGCIRMRNRDVEDLFRLVTVGITVELSAERLSLPPVSLPPAGRPAPEHEDAGITAQSFAESNPQSTKGE